MNLSQPVKQPQKTSTTPDADKPLSINPKKIARSLVYVTVFLTLIYIISGILEKMLGVESIVTKSLYYAFDMDGEDNIPSAFSFVILVLSAVLLIVIGKSTSITKHRKFWFLLSFIFLFLACDEFMQIHEKLGMYLKDSKESVGGSNFVWVLPYGIAALAVGFLFIRFVLQLPRKTRNLFFIAGFLYVFSALFIDYLQGIIQKQGLPKTYYKVLTCIEEPGEMIGVIIFIYALLDFLTYEKGSFKMQIEQPKTAGQV